MSDNNTNADTPVESNDTQYTSLEEAVFDTGSADNINDAFTSNVNQEQTTEPAPEQGQPEVSNQGNVEQTANNDEKRYQYWQSQADKYKNELQTLQQQQTQAFAQQQTQMPQQQMPQQPQQEEFPEAPERPAMPHGFNREEAYSDPSSASARYINELDDWRDDMNEYNSIKSQYQTALVEEKLNNMEAERQNEIKRQQAAAQVRQQEQEITNHVRGNYGMNEAEAADFVKKMSDPNSITVDNLVQLYRMQQGNAAPQQNPAPAQPSPAFTQTQNAQQVPSPMGVMPSGNTNVDGRKLEDKIMDTMIGNFNSKNPWK
tara:strand:- start:222 stop:1169 length:948 start_codon:yes stop_codon:yes gene_type:complete